MTRRAVRYCFLVFAVFISACSSLPPSGPPGRSAPPPQYFSLADSDATREIVMMSFSLLDTGYRFGGRNPEAGLDCSGMVSYVVEQVSGRQSRLLRHGCGDRFKQGENPLAVVHPAAVAEHDGVIGHAQRVQDGAAGAGITLAQRHVHRVVEYLDPLRRYAALKIGLACMIGDCEEALRQPRQQVTR